MIKPKFKLTDYVCMQCGNVNRTSVIKNTSHKQTLVLELWCYKCNNFAKHYNVQDIDLFMHTDTNDKIKNGIKDLVNTGVEAKKIKIKTLDKKISNK